MIILKNFIKYIGYYLIFLILLIIICSLLNLIGVNETITNALIFIFNSIMFLILGIRNGHLALKQGYVVGLKTGGFLILILIILNLFIKRFSITSIIYYMILLLCSTLGGILGINKKNKDSK